MDFLISNILCYFEKLSEDFPDTKEKLIEEIEENGSRVLSEMLKTGIDEIDDKYRTEIDNLNLLGGLGEGLAGLGGQLNKLNILSGVVPDPFGLFGGKKEIKKKAFKKFTSEFEIGDLDELLGGKFEDKISVQIFPSLLIMFYLEKDPELENKLMEIMMKIFNSRLFLKEIIIESDKSSARHCRN